jgi:Fic family protein
LDVSVLNLVAIEAAFRNLQQVFPEINKSLFDRRDPLDDEVVANMLEGYELVDRLLTDRVDILAMGQLKYWLKLNAIVLCGANAHDDQIHRSMLRATEVRFYDEPGAGIRDVMEWYARHLDQNVWRRSAGVFNRILSEPQLFFEGNHRTGALMMSYLLAREGKPPFVLTGENARGFFDPSSVIKKTKKRGLLTGIKFRLLTKDFADFLEHQKNPRFLSKLKT